MKQDLCGVKKNKKEIKPFKNSLKKFEAMLKRIAN